MAFSLAFQIFITVRRVVPVPYYLTSALSVLFSLATPSGYRGRQLRSR